MATIYDPESSDSDDEGSTLSLRIVKRPRGVSNNRRVILDGILSDDDENMSKSSERRSILEGVSKESDEEDRFDEDSGVLVDEDRSSCSCEDEFTALAENINNDDLNGTMLCQNPGTNYNEEIKKGAVLDTHCHLEFIRRRFGRDVSLADCLKLDGENLGDRFLGAIVNYCQPSEWYRGPGAVSPVLRDSARDRRVGVTVGCHPHFADQMTEAKWAQLEALVRSPSPQFPWLRVVAVGECGLDYSHKNTVPRSLQREVFARQLRLAIRLVLDTYDINVCRNINKHNMWRMLLQCSATSFIPMSKLSNFTPGSTSRWFFTFGTRRRTASRFAARSEFPRTILSTDTASAGMWTTPGHGSPSTKSAN